MNRSETNIRILLLISSLLLSMTMPIVTTGEDYNFDNFDSFLDLYNTASSTEKPAIIDEYITWQESSGGGFPAYQNDTHVVFIYYNTTRVVESCGVGGEFTEISGPWIIYPMTQLDEGVNFFYKYFSFHPKTAFEYIFSINGEWEEDFRNPLIMPYYDYGYVSSVLQMPQFSHTIDYAYREDIPHGSLNPLPEPFVNPYAEVYLPPNYDENLEYPTIYFEDGYAYHWMDAVNILDNLIADQKIAPVIAVFHDPIDMVRAEMASYPGIIRSKWYGCTLDYLDSMDELQGYIDDNYSTINDRDSRLIVGFSDGANTALYLGLERPKKFGLIGSQDGKFDYCGMMEETQDLKSEEYKIWISVGLYGSTVWSGNRTENTEQFVAIISDKGWDHEVFYLHEYHSFNSWRHTLDNLLEFFFPYQTDSDTDEVEFTFLIPYFIPATILAVFVNRKVRKYRG